MDVLKAVAQGKIVDVPVEGDTTFLNTIPDGLTPLYSGKVIILGTPVESGPINPRAQNMVNHLVIGDVVVVNQEQWHKIMQVQERARLEAAEALYKQRNGVPNELVDQQQEVQEP